MKHVSFIFLVTFLFVHLSWADGKIIEHREPEFLSFEELKSLSLDPQAKYALSEKLERFWQTPIVDNSAYYRGTKPRQLEDKRIGPFLRVASWNIEKSYRVPDAIRIFSYQQDIEPLIDGNKAPIRSRLHSAVMRQRARLASADVIVLQEMDLGVKRSGYIDAAAEIARALDMNYAYAPMQLEIDPVLLGLEKVRFEEGGVDEEATNFYAVDPKKYKGVFGSAVLSRYPIKSVQVFQLEHQAYDWYAEEKKKTSYFEVARRTGSKWLFQNQLTREIKVGGRIFFRVDLEVPGLPENALTVINVHLEIKCLPKGRQAQMAEILSYIKDIRNPVLLIGDFNSAWGDLSPTSAKRVAIRTVKDPTTWFSIGTTALLQSAFVVNTTRFVTNFTKNLQDPLAPHVPVVAPNTALPLFRMIRDFRFEDGGAFDFRGDRKRSVNGKKGMLANSNQRDRKGFKTTFSVKRPIAAIFGKYRLDWVFVKSFLKDSRDREGSYKFAPHFGETLEELNTSLWVPVSDHHPNVVDIPFEEPHAE